VVIVHGYGEHGGRYAHVANRLSADGYACYALDHRGHGRSGGHRGNIGRMADVAADLAAFIRTIGQCHPRTPRFLLAHSLGATT
jgi:acylglycerol lipase